MATRTAHLDYRQSGIPGVRGEVVSLAQALDRQKRSAQQAAPAVRQAGVANDFLGSVSQSAQGKIAGLASTFGPLGGGLNYVARSAPLAARGIIGYAAAAERAGLVNRALNPLILGTTTALGAGAVAIAAYGDDLLRAADNYTSLNARIRTFTDTVVQTAAVERDIYATARDARAPVESLVTLYTRLAPAVVDYGRAQADAMRFTELTTKAMAVQGADLREQAAASQQFAQAVGSGVLRGDEFKTLREAAPQLLRYVAANLEMNGKIGVSYSALKTLADEGLLSTGKLLDALERAGPQIEADFVNAPKTAQQGWSILKDTMTRAIGEIDKAVGGQQAVVRWLGEMADAADDFRERMVTSPEALDGLRAAKAFIGDMVGGMGALGQVGVENFDLIVLAGQAVIALKLGQVMAGWFSQAATASRSAVEALSRMRAEAREAVGVSLDPRGGQVLSSARFSAEAAGARATQLQAEADHKAAVAANVRQAADRAVVQAALAKQSASVSAASAAQAEAAASGLVTRAERAEAQAKQAGILATKAAAAATQTAIIADNAHAAVTGRVTAAMLVKHTAMRAGLALYGLLGGALGVTTLALGALLFALYKTEEAYQANWRAIEQGLDVGAQFLALENAIAAASYEQIGALDASTDAIYRKAEAMRQAAVRARELAQAQNDRLDGWQGRLGVAALNGLNPGSGSAYELGSRWRNNRIIERADTVLARANAEALADSFRALGSEADKAAKLSAEIDRILQTGQAPGNRPLTAQTRAAYERQRAENERFATNLYADLEATQKDLRGSLEAAKKVGDAGKVARLESDLSGLATAMAKADDAIRASEGPDGRKAPTAGGGGKVIKPKAVTVPGPVNSTLEELTRQEYLPKAGRDRFSLDAQGVIVDQTTGGVLTARSQDEAKAAAEYVKAIEAINAATDAQIAKTGESREALRQAASARLDHALKTSQASQAEEAWADKLAEVTGESRVMIKAEREVADLREKGARITDDAAAAYLGYVEAMERARKAAAALQQVEAQVQKAQRQIEAGQHAPTDAQGRIDAAAATEQALRNRGRLMQASEAAVQAIIDEEYRKGALRRENEAMRRQELMDAWRTAAEAVTADRIAEIHIQRAEDVSARQQELAEEYAGKIEGAFHDLVMGGDIEDVGKRLAIDLLETIYQELIGNPLRNWIKAAISDLLTPSGGAGGGGGLLGDLFGAILGGFGGGTGASIGSSAAGLGFAAIPGLAGGGPVRGPGGPRDDQVLLWGSNGEHMVNARAASRPGVRGLLDYLNAGGDLRLQALADGGAVGAGPSILAPVAIPQGVRPAYDAQRRGGAAASFTVQVDRRIFAPGADPENLNRVIRRQDEFERNETQRWVENFAAFRKATGS